jgi:hypothetical protein
MGSACGRQESYSFQSEHLNEKELSEHAETEGRIILKRTLKTITFEWIYLKQVESICGRSWTHWRTFEFLKNQGISLLLNWLSASQGLHISPLTHVLHSPYLIFLDSIILILFDVEYKLWGALQSKCLRTSLVFSLLKSDILLSICCIYYMGIHTYRERDESNLR